LAPGGKEQGEGGRMGATVGSGRVLTSVNFIDATTDGVRNDVGGGLAAKGGQRCPADRKRNLACGSFCVVSIFNRRLIVEKAQPEM